MNDDNPASASRPSEDDGVQGYEIDESQFLQGLYQVRVKIKVRTIRDWFRKLVAYMKGR